MADGQGDSARLSLPPEPESVTAARRFTTATLGAWGLAALAADAALVVSELVTNAVLHARTALEVHLHRSGPEVRLEVVDGSPVPVMPHVAAVAAPPPSLLGADDDSGAIEELLSAGATTGRGLQMVAQVVDEWGSEPVAGRPGKVVWARLGRGAGDPARGAADRAADQGPGPEGVGAVVPAVVAAQGRPDPVGHPVRLVAVPVRLALESDLNLETLLREFQVMGLAGAAADRPLGLVAAVTEILDLYAGPRRAGQVAVRAALERGDRLVDLDLVVPVTAGSMLRRLDDLLDEVATYCDRGDLLALAPSPELRQWRAWYTEEVGRQVAGAAPRPCPFSALAPGTAADSAPATLGATAQAALDRFRAAMEAAEDLRSVVQVLLGELIGPVGAASASLCLQAEGTDRVEIVDSIGMPGSVSDHWHSFGLGEDLPASEAMRTGRPVVLRTVSERNLRYPVFERTPVVDDLSFACIPVPRRAGPAVQDQPGPAAAPAVAAIVLGFASSRELGPSDLRLLTEMAGVTGQALGRLGQGRARSESDRRRSALAALADGLAGRAGLEERLVVATEILCGFFDSWVAAYVPDPDGLLRPVGGRHPDPEMQEFMRLVERTWPPRDPIDGAVRCFTTGTTVVFQTMPAEFLRSVARDREHFEMLGRMDVTAVVAAPVVTTGQVAAVLSASNRAGRWMTDTDVRLVEEASRLVAG